MLETVYKEYPQLAPSAGSDERSEHAPRARSEASGANGAARSAAVPGLVTSAISGRVSESPGQAAKFSPHVFRTAEECGRAAASIGPWSWDGHEGPIPQVEVYPGVIRLTAPNLARREASANRAADSPVIAAMGDGAEESAGRGEISGWSAKSRARMVARLAELDYAPMFLQGDFPAMVTLTYPGGWEVVAPNGEVVKGHLTSFFKRFERAWGVELICVWKMEFQSRGAPHFHLLMCPPSGRAGAHRQAAHAEKLAAYDAGVRATRPRWRPAVGDGLIFRDWLSAVWADIVAHPDLEQRKRHEMAGTAVDYSEGERGRDPKRMAVYFCKHGTFAAKEYQHDVPELWQEDGRGPGRFWGVRGLKRVKGAATISGDDMQVLGRVLRKYGTRTRAWSPERGHYFRPQMKSVLRWRARGVWVSPAGVRIVRKWQRRRTSVRVRRMTGSNSAGFLVVNDAPLLAEKLARALAAYKGCQGVLPAGMRGRIETGM